MLKKKIMKSLKVFEILWKKIKDNFLLRFIKKFFRFFYKIFAAVGSFFSFLGKMFFMLVGIGFFGCLVFFAIEEYFWQTGGPQQSAGGDVILKLDFSGSSESRTENIFLRKESEFLYYSKIIQGIYKAAKDDTVKALYMNMGSNVFPQEYFSDFRKAILYMGKQGKKTYFFTQTFGDGNGLDVYYLATAFQEIIMQDTGEFFPFGIAMESPFYKDALASFGITFEVVRRKDYKSLYESYTHNDRSVQDQEAMEKLLGDFYSLYIAGIQEQRKITDGELLDIKNYIVLPSALLKKEVSSDGKESKGFNFIDAFMYEEDFMDYIDKRHDTAEVFSFFNYLSDQEEEPAFAEDLSQQVGYFEIKGPIHSYDSTYDFWNPNDMLAAGATTIRSYLKDIEELGLKVIIVYINSPGGTVTGADTIWKALKKIRQKGIKVIVVMGDVAASGGYYIAAAADYIIASPVTVTGSVGVIMGKADFSGFWDLLGVRWNVVQQGSYGDMFSVNRKFTSQELEFLNASIDGTYKDFVQKMADSRGMSFEKFESMAQGRIWSGLTAYKNGMVDKIGGLEDAFIKAREYLELAPETPIGLSVYPKQDYLWQEWDILPGLEQYIGVHYLNGFISKGVKQVYDNILQLWVWDKVLDHSSFSPLVCSPELIFWKNP